jgi:hypothetical protein
MVPWCLDTNRLSPPASSMVTAPLLGSRSCSCCSHATFPPPREPEPSFICSSSVRQLACFHRDPILPSSCTKKALRKEFMIYMVLKISSVEGSDHGANPLLCLGFIAKRYLNSEALLVLPQIFFSRIYFPFLIICTPASQVCTGDEQAPHSAAQLIGISCVSPRAAQDPLAGPGRPSQPATLGP